MTTAPPAPSRLARPRKGRRRIGPIVAASLTAVLTAGALPAAATAAEVTDVTPPVLELSLNGTTAAGDLWNPTGAVFGGSDGESGLLHFDWKIVNIATSETPASGRWSAYQTIPAELSFQFITGTGDGRFQFVATATDRSGNVSGESTVPFRVDRTPPAIGLANSQLRSLKGVPAIPADPDAWIAAYGAQAFDVGGVGVESLTIDASAVRDVDGGHRVTMTARDLLGNTGTQNQTFVVAKTDPVVTADPIGYFEMGVDVRLTWQVWRDRFKVVGTPSSAFSPLASLTVDDLDLDLTVRDTYDVVFKAVDIWGFVGTVTTRVVVRDTIAPDVRIGVTEPSFGKGVGTRLATDGSDTAAWIDLLQATASDFGSGMPTGGTRGIEVDASVVDYSTSGTYPVQVTATDNAGNRTTTTVDYTVTRSGDPTIAVVAGVVTHELGTARPATGHAEWANLFGVTGRAAEGATVASITAEASEIDFSALGDYRVAFTVTDDEGGTAVAYGTFRIQDTIAPVVALQTGAAKRAMVAPASPWTDNDWIAFFGAAANDGSGSGVDQGTWNVEHAVDWLVAGDYEVTFTVDDNAGNTARSVTGTITIQAPPRGHAVAVRIAQNTPVSFEPLAGVTTTGAIEPLSSADLGSCIMGTASLEGDRVVYTPDTDVTGIDTFQVTVTDDLGQTATVDHTITIVPAPAVQAGVEFAHTVPVDGSLTIADAAQLEGIVGENLRLTGVTAPAGFRGDVTQDGADIAFATDRTEWVGEQSFSFTVTDDLGQELVVPVHLSVVGPTFSTDLHEGYAGKARVLAEAAGLVPGAEYRVVLDTAPQSLLGTIVADASGNASVRVLIPAGAPAGETRIMLYNADSQHRGSEDFTVLVDDIVQPPAGSDGPTAEFSLPSTGWGLAATGVNPMALVVAGAGAIVLGFPLLFLMRRRRRMQKEQPAEG